MYVMRNQSFFTLGTKYSLEMGILSLKDCPAARRVILSGIAMMMMAAESLSLSYYLSSFFILLPVSCRQHSRAGRHLAMEASFQLPQTVTLFCATPSYLVGRLYYFLPLASILSSFSLSLSLSQHSVSQFLLLIYYIMYIVSSIETFEMYVLIQLEPHCFEPLEQDFMLLPFVYVVNVG